MTRLLTPPNSWAAHPQGQDCGCEGPLALGGAGSGRASSFAAWAGLCPVLAQLGSLPFPEPVPRTPLPLCFHPLLPPPSTGASHNPAICYLPNL